MKDTKALETKFLYSLRIFLELAYKEIEIHIAQSIAPVTSKERCTGRSVS